MDEKHVRPAINHALPFAFDGHVMTEDSKGAPKVEAMKNKIPADLGDVKFLDSVLQRCITTLVTVYRLFGFDPTGWKQAPTLAHWRAMCAEIGGETAWLKVSKYKLAAFFSAWQRQPLPPSPFSASFHDDPSVLLRGRAHRWCRSALSGKHGLGEARFEFLTSVLYSKKGFPRPPRTALRAAEVETVKELTRERSTARHVRLRDWADVDRMRPSQLFNLTRDRLEDEMRRTVKELFGGAAYTVEDRVRCFFPSTSANYNLSRSGGGAVGAVLSDEDLLKDLRSETPLLQFRESREDEKKSVRAPLLSGGPGDATSGSLAPGSGYTCDVRPLQKVFGRFYWRLLAKADAEVPLVEPLALPESLKIRVISKGPPLTYTALKPLQRFMWKTLKSHPTFRLVGEPVTAELLEKQLGKRLKPDELYLSGDYANATNELHSWVSESIALAVAAELRLSQVETRLLVRALTQHVFQDEDGNWGPQKTGQLMGSVVSFPVLCIANAAATRFAIEQADGRKRQLKDCPMLINGDDIVARTTRLGCTLWKKVTAYGGLRESVGKTYYAREFLNVNSTMFRRQADAEGLVQPVPITQRAYGYSKDCVFSQVPYVNLGLLFAIKRSGERAGAKSVVSQKRYDATLGSLARELHRTCPFVLIDRVMTMFVGHHLDTLKHVRVPWFMPEWLGGVGLPRFTNSKTGEVMGPTELDYRKGASILWGSLDKVRRGSRAAWQMHRLAQDMLPQRPYELRGEDESQVATFSKNYERVYSAAVVSLLFDSRLPLRSLLADGTVDESLRALRSNERLWRDAAPLGAEKVASSDIVRLVAEGRERAPAALPFACVISS